MSSELTPSQKELITRIALTEDLDEEFEVDTMKGGDGSFGTVTAVTVTGKGKNVELIIKAASTNYKVRSVNPVRKAYLREIYVYNELLPTYRDFEIHTGSNDVFDGYPKIYGSIQDDNQECIVLENLSKTGFMLWDCKVPMNSEHVALVFTEYARFHAVSLAMSTRDPSAYDELTKDLTNVFETHSMAMAKTALDFGRKAVQGNALATSALDRLSACLEYFLTQELERCCSKVVIIHKDGWCNNVMFKYQDPNNLTRPTKANIIDWQLAERGSPILDLSFFLFTCASTEVIIDYPHHLGIYHDALRTSLARLSCNVDEVYPFHLLAVQWHKYSKFGLFMALIMIKFMLSEENEMPTISAMARCGMSFVDRLSFESVNSEIYNQRISEIITVLARSSLI